MTKELSSARILPSEPSVKDLSVYFRRQCAESSKVSGVLKIQTYLVCEKFKFVGSIVSLNVSGVSKVRVKILNVPGVLNVQTYLGYKNRNKSN